MDRHSIWIVLGMLLFLLNFLSLVLMLVGLQFDFMRWMDLFGRAWGFLLRLILMVFGLALVYTRLNQPADSR